MQTLVATLRRSGASVLLHLTALGDCVEFQAPDLYLDLPWPLLTAGEQTREWKISVALPFKEVKRINHIKRKKKQHICQMLAFWNFILIHIYFHLTFQEFFFGVTLQSTLPLLSYNPS